MSSGNIDILKIYPALVGLLFFLAGCGARPAYFFSPFNGTVPTYHTTPLQIDSVRNATYGSLLLSAGGANSRLTDEVSIFRPSIYRSYARENCQFYYGGSFTLGSYSVHEHDTSFNSLVDGKLINQHAGNKFFGGLGFNAGVNYTIPFRTRHEWRLGTETSFNYEFGNYLRFRKVIPDSAVTRIHRQRHFITLGLFTEFAFKHRDGSVGFKIGIGTPIGKNYTSTRVTNNESELFPFGYISPAFQYTNRRWTGSVQLIGTAHSFQTQAAVSYRLVNPNRN